MPTIQEYLERFPTTDEHRMELGRLERGNREVIKLCTALRDALKERFGDQALLLTITPMSYNNITENAGLEATKPRNYLSYEKIVIRLGAKEETFYLGAYENLVFFKADIYKGCLKFLENESTIPT